MTDRDDIMTSLVEVDDCVLVVIDIQDGFLSRYGEAVSRPLVTKVAWLIQVAEYLRVPIVAMGEDMEKIGDLNATVGDALPDGTTVHDKDSFNLADNPEILAAVDATGRKTAVLVGMETDVCVAQSALGLMGRGYRVVVLGDAVATSPGGEEVGLSRMRGAGALITSVRALYCEWLRGVTNCKQMRAAAPPDSPLALRPDNLGP